MAVNRSEKKELLDKLNALIRRQSLFQREINELERQIIHLDVIYGVFGAYSNAKDYRNHSYFIDEVSANKLFYL